MPQQSFQQNPRNEAEFHSVLLISWMSGLMKQGNKRPLTENDLFPVLEDFKAETILERAEKYWLDQIRQSSVYNTEPQLWKAVLRIIPLRAYVTMAALKLAWSLTYVLLPVCLWLVLKTLNDGPNMSYTSAILYVMLLGIIGIAKSLFTQHFDYMTELWGLRLKVAAIGLVYRRIISLSRQRMEAILSGNTLNLVSNDAQKLEKFLNRLFMVLATPFEIASTLFILWYLIGWQALVGAGLFLFIVTFVMLMAQKAAMLRQKAAQFTDQRLMIMKEIVSGIRALKMYAWESNYQNAIRDLRRKEMNTFRHKGIIVSMFLVLFCNTASASMAISVTALVLSGTVLTPFMVFTLLLGLLVLRFVFCITLGPCLLGTADAKVALDRMQSFLLDKTSDYKTSEMISQSHKLSYNLEGLQVQCKLTKYVKQDQLTEKAVTHTCNAIQHCRCTIPKTYAHSPNLSQQCKLETARTVHVSNNYSATGNVILFIAGASCSWKYNSCQSTLCDISLNIHQGQMAAITGPVGSGKTSLLMAILGELSLSKGQISCRGKVAFVPQIPWVFSGTIRDNILFGQPYNEQKFERVIRTCALSKDLKEFPNGDQTEIGQRGVSLSGGQKARVGLARAVYSEADIYLLDDPLSAVDAKVGKELLKKCILGTLSGRIRLLVTHQLQYLRDVGYIIVMENGSIAHRGEYEELKDTGAFLELSKFTIQEQESVNESASCAEEEAADKRQSPIAESEAVSQRATFRDLKEEEERKTAGVLTWRIYWKYFREALTVPFLIVLVLLLVSAQVSLIVPNWWLARLTSMPSEQQKKQINQVIYACQVAASIVVTATAYFFFYYTVLKASENLHNKMTTAIIKAPVLFFDRNPAGRILNRFSKDLGCMDDVLPTEFQMSVMLCLSALCAILVPAATNYWIFIALLPIIALFVYFARYYLKSSRELKRIEAIRCSPVYSHIAETVAGLEVVHCSKMQSTFLDRMNRYQDNNTQAFFLVVSSARWLGLRLDILASMFVTAVGIGAILIVESPALAGLSLTYALQTTDDCQYGLRLAAEVENLMTSVERVMAYTKLDQEPGYSTEALPSESWPQEGALELQDLSLAYMDGGPPVLKNISLSVPSKQKLGVVGRTGAGKSSLVSSLFRMPEPTGKVLIDGVDIGALNLQAARRSMAVITQDPVIFGGSLRRNLDPFSKYKDQQLWTALEEVQLKELVQRLPGQLGFQLKESGTNLSVGERQLVCLARALLQRSKIIVLDEATANVDFKTDRLIQQVIRSKFQDSTVVTIAHRLNTIIDYDKVLVLDGGRVVEFDKPEILLNKKDGLFAELLRSHQQGKE